MFTVRLPGLISCDCPQLFEGAEESTLMMVEAPAQLEQAKNLVELGAYAAGHDQALAAQRLSKQAGDDAGKMWAGTYLALAKAGLGHVSEAIEEIERSLSCFPIHGDDVNLRIVRCLAAGIWLNRTDHKALSRAWQLAEQSLAPANSGQTDWAHRMALARMAEIHLRQGERSRALDKSYMAVRLQEQESAGNIADPALPIYFTHANVLRALGDGRANNYLGLARQILAQRCCALSEPVHRRSYLYRVPLHRAICLAGDRRRAVNRLMIYDPMPLTD